jgi:hypothetical protein
MDSEYITMCKEAKEIQDVWLSHMGSPYDKVIHIENYKVMAEVPHDNMTFAIIPYTPEIYRSSELSDYVWLPRAEDLQRIASELLSLNMEDLSSDYYEFLYDPSTLITGWLEYVMLKCFNKTWQWVDRIWVEI